MARTPRLRKVVAPPRFKGFKPYGHTSDNPVAVELLYEEYEALKLADYDFLDHQAASQLMGVSRATFARIYESARRKMALALVEIREIKTVYGNAWMDKNWFRCKKCQARFSMPKTVDGSKCALCASSDIVPIRPENK
jgi:predicted DNA-binding protein (UPF0251 family)